MAADNDSWRIQRPLVQPAFHHQTLKRIVDHLDRALDRVFAEWDELEPGTVIDVDAAMMRATLEIVGHSLFGEDLSADADRLARASLDALEVVVARARVPITPPSWFPSPGNRKLGRAVEALDDSVRRMLVARLGVRSSEPDMLDLLVNARDEAGHGLSGQEIRDQIVTFIVAGHETIGSTLSWACALVAGDPRVRAELQREADEVLAGRAPTFADYQRLPFAKAVLDETLRLYPPAWLITRKSLAPDNLAGVAVPAGALVIVSPWLLHRHPAAWRDAESFDPWRFLQDRAERDAFIPFGAGPRQCIGRDFSYVEGTLMLARIASRYELAAPGPVTLPAAEPLVTLRPVGGVPLRVTPRVLSP